MKTNWISRNEGKHETICMKSLALNFDDYIEDKSQLKEFVSDGLSLTEMLLNWLEENPTVDWYPDRYFFRDGKNAMTIWYRTAKVNR